ncbi:unnamed protein product [Brachionus calyciflorus]|uniref:Uncharacterized protein n=1 Tax=Brachionus calyciflorus TaxID=104777 RepID=A0A813QUB8_9BILA|nr:unnamed protein product [Brachionus calyciflorus]
MNNNLNEIVKHDTTDIRIPLKTQIIEKSTSSQRTNPRVKLEQINKPKNISDEKNSRSPSSKAIEPMDILHEIIGTVIEAKVKEYDKRLSGLETLNLNHKNQSIEISDSVKMKKTDLMYVVDSNSQNHKLTKDMLNMLVDRILKT